MVGIGVNDPNDRPIIGPTVSMKGQLPNEKASCSAIQFGEGILNCSESKREPRVQQPPGGDALAIQDHLGFDPRYPCADSEEEPGRGRAVGSAEHGAECSHEPLVRHRVRTADIDRTGYWNVEHRMQGRSDIGDVNPAHKLGPRTGVAAEEQFGQPFQGLQRTSSAG